VTGAEAVDSGASALVVVFCTCPDAAVAAALASALLDDHLVACVNVVSGITSHYRWQGKLEQAAEVLCLIKCRSTDVDLVAARIKTLHPYDVPELIAVPVVAGLPAYLEWVVEETIR
jgi:periplasmic divalent cation tolerance protein